MTAWTAAELDTIGRAEEIEIAALRPDGTLRKPVIIWIARAGDDIYVRSAYGRTAAWYRGTQLRHEGRIKAGGIEKDITFAAVDPALHDAIDAAFRTKYSRQPAQYVNMVLTDEARFTTLRLTPR
ncbi:MAG TPA: DUF2255 family protein [Acetobacteraceae bacterium]|jgi:hypothetical protein|nr:DUF2255 family protein [Acetobacteraceae bacterium]